MPNRESETPALDAMLRLMDMAGVSPEPEQLRLLRAHARREHVGRQDADCRACRKFPEGGEADHAE